MSPLRNAFEDLATEPTLAKRFGGGKLPFSTTVTAAGDTTLIDPALGNAIEVLWVYAFADPDLTTSPKMTFRFGAQDPFYTMFPFAHWEPYSGEVNEALIINLSEASDVAVSITYREFTP